MANLQRWYGLCNMDASLLFVNFERALKKETSREDRKCVSCVSPSATNMIADIAECWWGLRKYFIIIIFFFCIFIRLFLIHFWLCMTRRWWSGCCCRCSDIDFSPNTNAVCSSVVWHPARIACTTVHAWMELGTAKTFDYRSRRKSEFRATAEIEKGKRWHTLKLLLGKQKRKKRKRTDSIELHIDLYFDA